MTKTSKSLLPLSIFFLFFSCNSRQPTGASLAVDESSEIHFNSKVCTKSKKAVSRISRVKIGQQEFITLESDICTQKKHVTSGMGLTENERPPVFVYYGYAGNDKLTMDMRKETVASAKQMGYRVLDVSEKPIGQAQQMIFADRVRNPGDYAAGRPVTINIGAHGGQPDEANPYHYIGRTTTANLPNTPNLPDGTVVSTSETMRSTDVAGALITGAGHDASIVCSMQSCFGGAMQNDPNFAKIQNSNVNPKQVRTFVFGADADHPAITTSRVDQNRNLQSNPYAIEQTTQQMFLGANNGAGVTVQDFQRTLAAKNFTSPEIKATNYYFSGPGVVDSHGGPDLEYAYEGININTARSGSSVVTNAKDPGSVFLVPPGLKNPGNMTQPLSEREWDSAKIPTSAGQLQTPTKPMPAQEVSVADLENQSSF